MSPIRPLLFLTLRSLVNGVKRSLGSPRRLFTLLAVVGYYFAFFILPALGRRDPPPVGGGVPIVDFPPLQVIDAFAFGLFSALSLVMVLGVMSYQGGFRPADVDILFATPIPPKAVLLFRIIRDYLVTLIMPFFIVLVGLRPARMGWEAVFRNMPNPQYSNLAAKAMTLSWILMALGWVTIGYAVSLWVSRSDNKSDRNRWVLSGLIIAYVVGVAAFLAFRLRGATGLSDLVDAAQSPYLRFAFLGATFATEMTLAPLYGNIWMAVRGIGGLLGIVGLGLMFAMSQSEWMYDQAAARGFKASKSRELQRSGDYMGLMAERARNKRVKVRSGTVFHRLRWQGPLALLWKELFLQPRGMGAMLLLLVLMALAMGAIPVFVGPGDVDKEMGLGALYLVMQGSTLMMVTMALSQVGFLELLKRVDLQKPLPFTPAATVFYEVLAKGLLGAGICWVGSILMLAMRPGLWDYALAGLIMAPFASVLLSAIVCFCTILFPDVDDAAQRQFRGLVSMLGIIIAGLLPALAFILVSFGLHAPMFLGALAGSVVALLMSIGVCWVAGLMYATYNPSE